MADLIAPLSIQVPIVDPKTGTPTPQFHRVLQRLRFGLGFTIRRGGEIFLSDGSVTNLQLADMANKTIKARKTAAAGFPEDCTLSEILDFIGPAAQGDILYRDATAWQRLPAGTAGNYLKTQGPAANPIWSTVVATANPWWFNPPLAASFPTLISFDATMPVLSDTAHGGMKLLWPANYGTTDQSKGALKALPVGVDWSVRARFHVMAADTNFTYGGLCVRNSVANKTVTYGKSNYATLAGHVIIGQTANTGQALLNTTATTGANNHPMHVQLRWTQATSILAVDFSLDGENWLQGDSRNVATLIGAAPDQVGFKLHAGGGSAASGAQQPFLMVDRWEQSF